jgi:hypothetical protein
MGDFQPRRGIWQAEVVGRADELRARLEVSKGAKGAAANLGDAATFKAVERSLESAERAAGPIKRGASLKAWWSGAAITEAWESIHHAELALLTVESERDAKGILPRLLAWIEAAIEDPKRLARHEKALATQIEKNEFDGVRVRAALMDVIAANRDRYANLRVFRNILIAVTGLLATLVILVIAWHAVNPNFLSLCPNGTTTCLSGPAKAEVALIALLGAIGGTLALAFGLSESERAPSRYDPKVWLAFLKPVTGAVTALLGVIFIQAEFLVQPAGKSSYLLLVYAILFGFSQQLFTRVADRRADELTGSANKRS